MTGPAVSVRGLTRKFGDFRALDDVTLHIPANVITGLLGRNGAGKTTLMRVLTGREFATTGEVEVFGADPRENEAVLTRIALVGESQAYPDHFRVEHVLRAAQLLFPRWDAAYAQALTADFGLPRGRPVKKLSRGMLSSLGIVVGLASRAPLTLFDEPYLGLDPVTRQLFYDHLLADYTEHPRTVLLSTHLIDEMGDLLEHVVLIDRGRIVLDEDAESLRGRALAVTGPAAAVERFTAGHDVLHRQQLGGLTRATTVGPRDDRLARDLGLTVEPVSLQQFVVHTTRRDPAEPALSGSRGTGGSR